MRLTLETTITMMSVIQLILNAILLNETVRRNTGNIIYTVKGLTNHNHMSYLMIDPSILSLVCVFQGLAHHRSQLNLPYSHMKIYISSQQSDQTIDLPSERK